MSIRYLLWGEPGAGKAGGWWLGLGAGFFASGEGSSAVGEGGVQRADEFGDAGYVMTGAPLFEALGEALGGAGIGVAGGADLDGGGSGEEKFDRVFRSDDAAESDDGDGDGFGRFPDHAHGDGLDGRAGEAAGDVRESRERRVSTSMGSARKVLTRETASAPAFCAELAMAAMEVTLGESLTMTGRRERDLARETRSKSMSTSEPKAMPPFLVLGQEALIS